MDSQSAFERLMLNGNNPPTSLISLVDPENRRYEQPMEKGVTVKFRRTYFREPGIYVSKKGSEIAIRLAWVSEAIFVVPNSDR